MDTMMKKFLGASAITIAIIGFAHGANIANVSLDFCTTTSSTVEYHLDPGVETGICYSITNNGDAPVKVKVGFVDGTFTNDQQQNKACLGDNDIGNFGRYVTQSGYEIALNAGETAKKDAKLLYATGMNGLFHGCIVYSLVEDKPNTISGFTIIMRKAKFIDVFLGNSQPPLHITGIVLEDFSKADGENISRDPKVRIYKDATDGTYIVEIKVKNISPTDQEVMITGEISNILGYHDAFVETRKMLSGESLIITKNIGAVQPYDLKIKFTVNNTPFDFDTPAQVNGTFEKEAIIGKGKVIGYLVLMAIILFRGVSSLLMREKRKRKKMIHHPHHEGHQHHEGHVHPHRPQHQHHPEHKHHSEHKHHR